MNSQAKDRDALAAATRSDVNGLKRLPERPLLPQIRRSRTHIEMTGVRPTEASKAAVCYVRNTSTAAVAFAQLAVIPTGVPNGSNRPWAASRWLGWLRSAGTLSIGRRAAQAFLCYLDDT
jgi:hypothetical protein